MRKLCQRPQPAGHGAGAACTEGPELRAQQTRLKIALPEVLIGRVGALVAEMQAVVRLPSKSPTSEMTLGRTLSILVAAIGMSVLTGCVSPGPGSYYVGGPGYYGGGYYGGGYYGGGGGYYAGGGYYRRGGYYRGGRYGYGRGVYGRPGFGYHGRPYGRAGFGHRRYGGGRAAFR